MIEWRGIYLPDGEEHLQYWMKTVGHVRDGKPTYQYHKYSAAMEFVKTKGRAIDIGAHAGLWSRVMALDFDVVTAFEPVPEHVSCWKKNLEGFTNVTLHEVALGRLPGTVQMHTRTPGSSGDTSVALMGQEPNAAQAVPMHTLDDYLIDYIDFLKIDNEGYEYYGLRGAESTLLRCRPVVIVEQKPGMGKRFGLGEIDAVKYLQRLGAVLRIAIQGDYILSWDK